MCQLEIGLRTSENSRLPQKRFKCIKSGLLGRNASFYSLSSCMFPSIMTIPPIITFHINAKIMQFSGVESQNSAFYHDLDYQDTNYLHILSSNLTMHVKTILNEDDTYPSFVTVFNRLQSTKFYLIFQYNIFDMIDGHIIRFLTFFSMLLYGWGNIYKIISWHVWNLFTCYRVRGMSNCHYQHLNVAINKQSLSSITYHKHIKLRH